MSDGRRHMVLYEQIDGSFRIPAEFGRCMGSTLDPPKLNEDTPSPHVLSRSQEYQDDLARLRFENYLYKEKHIQLLRQLEELVQLNRIISNKLDIAIQNTEEGITIASPPTTTMRAVSVGGTHLLRLDTVQAALTESGSTSGHAPKGTNLDNCNLFPPKKRHRQL